MDAKLEGLIKSLVLFGKKHKSLIYPIVALLLTMGTAYEGINATKKLINSTVKQIKEFLPKKRIYRQSIKTLNLIKFKDKLLSDTPKIAVNFVSMLKQITRQRFIAGALSACLIFGFFPSAVFAAEEVNPVPTDTATDMIEDISGTDTCVCAVLCTENAANMDCPLCSAPKADLKLCLGKAAEEQTEQKKEEAPPSDESTDKIPTEATARNTANVATIGATAYPSLGAAVTAATPGDKITLTADDTTSSQRIEISKNLSIELDGHSLPSTTFKLTDGNISISDSKGTGEIGKMISNDGIYIDGATVTLNNIRVFSGNGNAKAIRLLSGALTVNGGVYTGQGSNGSDAIFVKLGTLTINDGVFQCVNYGCGLSYSGSPENLKIKKGTFIGGDNQGGFWLSSSSIETKADVESVFLKDSKGSFVVLADGAEFDKDNVVIGSGLFTSDGFKEPENGSTNKDEPAVLSPSSGDSVTLAPQILGGSGNTSTLEYEWSKDNEVLTEETGPTHTITDYNPTDDDGAYSVTIKDPALPDAPIEIFWQVGESGGGTGGGSATPDSHAHTTELTAGGNLATGSYYLTGDMTTDVTSIAIIGDSVVNLCLNGHKLNGKIQTYGTSTLNLYDCSANKTGEIYSEKATDSIYVIDNYSTGDVNIFGGSVTSKGDNDTSITNTATGNAIRNSSTGNINISGGNISTFGANCGDTICNGDTGTINITGGVVANTGKTKDAGPVAAINNLGNGKINITGGTVKSSGESGLALHNFAGGTVTISGDETKVLYEGKPDSFGEAIRNLKAGTINIKGGTISATGRKARTIYNVSTGTVNVTGGKVICAATDNDGVVSYSGNSNPTGVTFTSNVTISPEGAMDPATKLTYEATTKTAVITDGKATYTLTGGSDPAPSNWLVYSESIGPTLAKDVTATLSGTTLTLGGNGLKAGKYYISAYDRVNGKGASDRVTSRPRLELTTTLPAIATSIKINGTDYTGTYDNLQAAVTASKILAADIKSLEIITGNVIEADWLAIKTIAPKLQTLTIHEAVNVADIPDYPNWINDKYKSLFPTTIASVSIPQSITIGVNAFYNCKVLTSISLPNVTELASASFYGCIGLQEVQMDSVEIIGGRSLDDKTGKGAFYGCNQLKKFTAPKLTTAGTSSFGNCKLLSEFNAPLLTTIEESAFSSAAFTSVNFPNVTTLGKSAFSYCEKLVEATFASLTETAGGFNGCIALERFTAPNLSIVGNNMFDGCTALTQVSTEAITKIGNSAFQNCAKLAFPKFPNVITIETGAFYGCKLFTHVEFPKAETLTGSVFNQCENLVSASLPAVTSMTGSVFKTNKALTALYLPASPPAVDNDTFLTSYPVPSRTIYFIDENSDPLTGDALTTAHDNYKAVNDGNTTDVMWYKWALGAPEAQWKSADETSKGIGTLYDSLKAVSKIGGKVTVLMDYNYGEGTLPLEFTAVDNKNEIGLTKDVTLDLAGHSLSFPKMQNQPFRFESNTGKFTVTDTGKTGKITTKSNAVFMCLDNAKFEITGGTYSVDNADPFGAVSYFTEDTTVDVLRAGLKRIVPSGYLFDPADIIVEDYDYTASTATTVKIVPDVMAPMPQNVKVTRTDNYKRPIISWDAVEGGSPEYTVTLYSVTADEAPKTTNTLTEISKATTAKTSLTWQTDLTEGTRYVFGVTAKVTDKEFASKEAISRVYNCAANPTAPGGKIEKPTTQENVDSVFGEGNATLEGDKIIINNDITVEGTITIAPDVTIDLNDNTLTGKDGVDPVISVTSPANVTITGPGSIIGGNGTDDNLNGGNAINGDDSSIDESNVTINGGANVIGGNGIDNGNGGDGIDLGVSGNITVDKGTVTGGTGTTGGNGAVTGTGDITVNDGGVISGGTGTTGGNGATTGAGDITVNTGGAVSGGNGTNGSGDNSTGGTGGIGTITGTGNTTVNGTVTGGNGGDNNGTGNGGNGGVGANEDEEIKGNGTITGGNGGNITEGGTGNVGSGGNAITGGGTFPSGNPKPGGDGVNATQKVESVSGAPTVTVPPQDLINGAVTEDDRKDNTITKIDVTLTVEKKEPSTTDKDKVIEEVKDGQEVGIYLDITLEKVLTKNNTAQPSEKVTEATQPITITVEIPANMRGGSNYTIIRVHGSSVDTIEPTQITETTLTFKTDKFSTYAIAYTPGEVTTPDNNTPPPYYGNTTGGSSSAPTEQEPNLPSEGKVDISGSADNKGNVTIAITDKAISDAIKKAEDNALKNGNTNAKFTLSLNSNAGSSKSNSVTVNLPKSAQEKIIASSISNTVIAVSNPQIKVSLSLATVKEIYRQAKADVNITATKLDNNKLKGDAKAAIANRPLFELKLSYGKDKQLVTLGANSIILTIPYSLQKGELSGGLIAAYVTNNKNVSYINHSSYDKNDKVIRFAISRPSSCGISYKSPTAFKDITNHPLKEDIDFAAARGLINETKDNFYPNGPITRGVFITALGKLANVNVSNYKAVKLTDIKAEDYYAPYAQWASEKGILKGTTFGPYVAMSRQTMAEIICNYTKAIGFDLPLVHTENFFDDKQAIAYNATDSIKQLQMAGILLGKDENKFDPYGTVTRAEFFAILHRLQDLILEESTAQGFKQNDIGSQMYFENGNPIKNQTKFINNKAYTFNSFGITTDHIQKETISNSTSGNADVSNSAAIRYVVKSGDSFWKISKEHNVNINTLVKANKMTTTSAIYPGDVLTIPM